MSYDQFCADRKTINAVVRSMEIIGQAAKKIPADIRAKNPELPWIEIAGMRDKLVHEYFGVDLEIVWETARNDLAPLEITIQNMLREEE